MVRLVCLISVLLLALAALGQQAPVKLVQVVTFPPDAEIRDPQGQPIGRSGDGAEIRGRAFEMIADPMRITIVSPGHDEVAVTLSGQDVLTDRYPAEGALALTPQGFGQALLDQWRWRRSRIYLALVALGLAAAGGARVLKGWHKLRAHDQRQARLTALAPEEGAPSGLVLTQIGDYRVVKLLGKGGFSEVYQGVPEASLNDQDSVAIKVLNEDLRDRPDAIERFEREVSLTSELTHPGIVETIDWGWQAGRLYLVMEYVKGCELRELLTDLQGDRERALQLLWQLMEAVSFAHSRGISHRDLKPENVMVTSTGRVKVMDFGLGRAVDSKTLTQTGTAMGSPRYIAPEAIGGKNVDDRADQYSLGVMAYELLAGRLPFDGDQVMQLLYSHTHLQAEPPSSISSLPKACDDVILRMMSKLPQDRYRSVEQAREELMAALASP